MSKLIEHCRSCNAEIVWLKTKLKKHIPVNADTVKDDGQEFDPLVHVSHFATCPQAKRWRKGKTP